LKYHFLNKIASLSITISQVFKLFVVLFVAALATLGLVDLCNYGVANSLKFLKLLLEFLKLSFVVAIQPLLSLGEGVRDSVLVVLLELIGELIFIFNCVAHLVDVVFKLMLGVNLLLKELVALSELFSVSNHLFDFFGGKSSFIIGD
jgi:hypothetical protein